MEYVKIVNPGDTYTSIATTEEKMAKFGCVNVGRGLPIKDYYYEVIARNPHPLYVNTELTSIQDSDGNQFIVGPDAWVPDDLDYDSAKPMPKPTKMRTAPQPPEYKQVLEKVNLGDMVAIVNKSNSSYRTNPKENIWIVSGLNKYSYDIILADPKIPNVDKVGVFRKDVEIYHPEPELEPDDKPQFSRNEMLEILNQGKTPEEIILDLMDHITN